MLVTRDPALVRWTSKVAHLDEVPDVECAVTADGECELAAWMDTWRVQGYR